LFSNPNQHKEAFTKFERELQYLHKRLKEKDELLSQRDTKILILEQINNEVTMKEAETSRILNEKISELKEILERKETLF